MSRTYWRRSDGISPNDCGGNHLNSAGAQVAGGLVSPGQQPRVYSDTNGAGKNRVSWLTPWVLARYRSSNLRPESHMKSSRFSSLFFLFAVACGAPSTVATRPTPTAPPAAAPSAPAVSQPASVPPVTLAEAPRNWQLLDEGINHVPGVSSERAMNELLAGKAPKKKVLVAIIDNGIDTSHVDLKANLWVNPKETPGNHVDDDHNGHIDDIHGWNFIGGTDGQDVHFDTFEVTREYARCHGGAAASGSPKIDDAARCAEVTAAFEKQRNSIQSSVTNYKGALDVLRQITPLLRQAVAPDTLSTARVRALSPTTPQLTQARQIYLQLADEGATE